MRHRTSGRRERRRAVATVVVGALALAAVLPGIAAALTTDDAPTTWNWQLDAQGSDDEPNQKDLTAHAAALGQDDTFWVTWKWDDTRFPGNNSGDACSLFDTAPFDALVDAAVCVTVKGIDAEQVRTSPRVYLCDDDSEDRCFGARLVGSGSDLSTACSVDSTAPEAFGGSTADTQAICHVDLTEIDAGSTPILRNTCSYPSQEPNSDPSDCVLAGVVPPIDTTPSTTAETTAILADDVALPSNAVGTVVFRLYADDPAAETETLCDTLLYETGEIAVADGTASSMDDPNLPEPGPYTETITADTTYSWEAHFTSGTDFYLDADAPCGETTTVTVATVAP